MSKLLWCGVLVMMLGAGVAAIKQYWMPARSLPVAAAPTPAELRRFSAPTPAAAPTPLPTVPPVDDVSEPIVTRPELLEVLPEIRTTLPTTGGAAESEVAATRAPRPDLETRRMPYADDDEFRDLLVQIRGPSSRLSWAGLWRWAFQLNQRDLSGVEESDEPPLLDPVPPGHDHPPHCPYGGYCPYPNSYRYPLPR